MQDTSQGFAFVTADHPDSFRTYSTRREIRKHVRSNTLRRRQHDALIAAEDKAEDDSENKPSARVANKAVVRSKRPQEGNDRHDGWSGMGVSGFSTADLAYIITRPRSIAPSPDWFRWLPRNDSRPFNLEGLIKHWFSAYGRCAPPKYLNFLTSSEMALTSYALPCALSKSVTSREPARSLEYLHARQQSIIQINKGLRQPKVSQETIMCIKHLLFADLFVGSRTTLWAHVKAIDNLVKLQGGLEALHEYELGHFVRIHVLWGCVIANIRAPKEFLEANTPAVDFCDRPSPLPTRFNESPLIWWSEHMSSLLSSQYCTPSLHSLTCELRDLTRSLLLFGSVPLAETNKAWQRILRNHSTTLISSDSSFKTKVDRKSAWIAESCRLAGLIYAAALVHHVPISQAPAKLKDIALSSSILEDLSSAILMTDFWGTDPAWGELIGSYFWVVYVTAAAGYRNLDNMSGPEKDKALLQRAVMTQPATYTIQLFHHPPLADDALRSIKTMLRVQALLATPPSSTFEGPQTQGVDSLLDGPADDINPSTMPIDVLLNMTHISCKRPDFDAVNSASPN